MIFLINEWESNVQIDAQVQIYNKRAGSNTNIPYTSTLGYKYNAQVQINKYKYTINEYNIQYGHYNTESNKSIPGAWITTKYEPYDGRFRWKLGITMQVKSC